MKREELSIIVTVILTAVVVIVLFRFAAGEPIEWINIGGIIIGATIGSMVGITLVRIFSRKR